MDNNKFSFKNFKLLPKKQQRAVYTIVFSLLAFILVVIISCVFLFAGGKGSANSSSSQSQSESSSNSSSGDTVKDPITNSKYGDTILKKQDNTDINYLKETLFIGDSNTERLMQYGHISIDNYVGKVGLSIAGASSEACVYFKNDDKAYTIPAAVAKMKPRRVVVTLGTNDAGESVNPKDFLKSYESFIKAVTDSYPHAQIIINAIPPVTKNSTYKSINMDKINDLNEALADFALEKNYKFLNSSELLRDTNGYGKASYFTKEDGVHFVDSGARAFIDYVRTHPETTEDKRPDTTNIPTRRAAPSTTSSSSSSSSSEAVEYKTITYSVDMDQKTAMGSLKNDTFDKKQSYTHTFKDEDKKFSITAVAADGYTFSKWSDGVKEATRTDSVPKQSLKITAQFTKKTAFTISLDKNDGDKVEEGQEFKITATVTGDKVDVEKVVWKVDGAHVSTGKTFTGKYSPDKETAYTIEASYPDQEIKATIKIIVTKKSTSTPIPTPTPPVSSTVVTITGPNEGTVGTPINFTATLNAGDPAKTVWTVAGTSVTFTGATFNYLPGSVGDVTITATNNGGTQSKKVTIHDIKREIVERSGVPASAKKGDTASISVYYKLGEAENAEETGKLSWSITGPVSSSGSGGSFNFQFTEAGTYTLNVKGNGVERTFPAIQVTEP